MTGLQNVWIIKASNSSKGVGITLFDQLSQVSSSSSSYATCILLLILSSARAWASPCFTNSRRWQTCILPLI